MKKLLYFSAALLAIVSCNKATPVASDSQIQFRLSLPSTKATASSFEAVYLFGIQVIEA